jgi:hypothetical protein
MHQPSSTRVAYRYLTASPHEPSILDGLPRRKAVALVNAVLGKAPTAGYFRDEYWQGIKAIWKTLEHEKISFGITKSDYEHENGRPVRKVWKFEVEFTNDKGKRDTVYGHVVAGGAGPVDDPLARYDVVAYAN